MGKFSGMLLISDVDGTLLDYEKGLSPRNVEAIDAFAREGGLFTVCTGRSALGFQHLARELPLNAPWLLSNGAAIYDPKADKLLYEGFLTGPYRRLLDEALARFPSVGLEVHQSWRKYTINTNSFIRDHLTRVQCEADSVVRPQDAPDPWIKLLFVDEPDLLRELADWLIPAWGERYSVVFSNPFMAEVQNRGIDKADGARRLAELLGITPDCVYTVGDEQNDLAMLLAYESFAPANATPEAKSAATHQLKTHCADGAIAEVIDYLGAKR